MKIISLYSSNLCDVPMLFLGSNELLFRRMPCIFIQLANHSVQVDN